MHSGFSPHQVSPQTLTPRFAHLILLSGFLPLRLNQLGDALSCFPLIMTKAVMMSPPVPFFAIIVWQPVFDVSDSPTAATFIVFSTFFNASHQSFLMANSP
jgi:hypothetical protein